MASKKQECPTCEEVPVWLTTYGDMVTLLLTFFVMLFSIGKATPQEIQLILSAFSNSLGMFEGGQTLSKGRLEEMGMNLEALPSQTAGRSLSSAKAQAKSIFKPEIEARKVRIDEDERGIIISLIGADYFEPGSALPTPAMEDALAKAAGLINSLNRYARVEGHASADEARLRAASDEERDYANVWDLAGARAINSIVFMQAKGVKPHLLQGMSYGSYRPLRNEGEEGTPEAKAHNRRIDIVILPEKEPDRSRSEASEGLPGTRIPGAEYLIPDR